MRRRMCTCEDAKMLRKGEDVREGEREGVTM